MIATREKWREFDSQLHLEFSFSFSCRSLKFQYQKIKPRIFQGYTMKIMKV